ncbi:hypothetical protein [Amycolatopsis sp. NPDC054798]
MLWPEEWKFFVRSLDKDEVVAYRAEPGGRLGRLRERQIWDEQLGGLNRGYEAYASEAWNIALQVPGQYWGLCEHVGSAQCDKSSYSGHPYRLSNTLPDPRLCGRVFLAIERVSLSSVGDSVDGPWYPFRIADVDLQC